MIWIRVSSQWIYPLQRTTVIFEELYQGDQKLAVYADIEDTDQQISFPEIGTKAKDSDTKENIANADEKVKLTDTIFFKGHEIVVFEKLYVTVKEDEGVTEVELTSHEDIEAKSQTVKLTEIPTEPKEPDTPTLSAPKTGDNTNLWIPVVALLAALGGIVTVIIRIRRKRF